MYGTVLFHVEAGIKPRNPFAVTKAETSQGPLCITFSLRVFALVLYETVELANEQMNPLAHFGRVANEVQRSVDRPGFGRVEALHLLRRELLVLLERFVQTSLHPCVSKHDH